VQIFPSFKTKFEICRTLFYHNTRPQNLISSCVGDIEDLLQYLEQVESMVQKNDLQYLSYERGDAVAKEGDATLAPKILRSLELANLCRTSINSMDRATKAILTNAQTARHSLKSAIIATAPQQSSTSSSSLNT
jgi:hypothetical protein